jgi:hypothetical protein
MGVKLSIDKHTSELDDILEMNPNYLSKVQFESKISPSITQHLKIWRFYESKKAYDTVKSSPVPLHNITDNQFFFSGDEAYLILLIYKNGKELQNDLANFPHSLWGVVNSVENLTPRGLSSTFKTNNDHLENHSLDSFLLSKRRDEKDISSKQSNDDQRYKYMLFCWNGKNSGASVKSQTLTKGYALDEYLQQAQDSGLHVLFSGGVIKNKKLQRGNIFEF